MTDKEFLTLAAAIRTYYPKDNFLPTRDAVTLWFDALKDLDYKTAETAVKKWVAVSKWPPTIADIRQTSAEIVSEQTDWGEAWAKVCAAIQKYGYYRPREAMETFDDLTRAVVERIGFLNLCDSENFAVERANFRMIYEQLANRRREEEQMPPEVRERIEQIRQKCTKPEIEEEKKPAIEDNEIYIQAPDDFIEKIGRR